MTPIPNQAQPNQAQKPKPLNWRNEIAPLRTRIMLVCWPVLVFLLSTSALVVQAYEPEQTNGYIVAAIQPDISPENRISKKPGKDVVAMGNQNQTMPVRYIVLSFLAGTIGAIFLVFIWNFKWNQSLRQKIKQCTKDHEVSEQNLSAIMENSRDGILVNQDGKHVFANRHIAELLGYSPEQLIGTGIEIIIHPDELEKVAARFKARMQGGPVPDQYESIIVDRLGNSIPVEITAAPTLWQGRPAGMASIHDISKRKAAEEELRKSKERFELAVDGSSDGIWDWDVATNEAYFSPRFKELLGYAKDDDTLDSFTDFESRLHADDRNRIMQELKDHFEKHYPYNTEYRLKKKSGEYGWFLARGQALWDENGKPFRMAGSVSDINDRKLIDAELWAAKVSLETKVEQGSEALRASENKLAYLLGNSPVVIYTCEVGGNFGATYISENVKELFGYSQADFLNDSNFWADNIHPDDAPQVFRGLEELFKGGRHSHEYRYRKPDGSYCWVHDEFKLMYDRNHKPLEILGYWADITANKVTENILQESEIRQRTVLNNMVNGLITIDNKGVIESINKAGQKLFDYREDELIGRNVSMLMPEPDRSAHDGYIKRYLATGKAHVIGIVREVMCCRKDGSTFPAELSISEMFIGNKRLFSGIIHDITLRKEAESAVRRSEERLNRSQVFANIGTWDWDIQTGELYWSERVGPLFGYKNDVPETTYDNFLKAIHPDDRQKVIQAVNNCIDKGADYNIEHRVVWPDGSIHWMLERGDVVRDADGAPLHMLGVVQDVTDRSKMAQRLEQSRIEAEQANQAKSYFLSSMSHELRTPMNAILGFAQLLQLTPLTDEQKDNAEEIIKAGKHLLDLINEVLDLAKIEAGSIDLKIESVESRVVIEECVGLVKPLTRSHDVRMVFLNKGCESLTVVADYTRLKQVLLNLLANAIKYSPKGSEVTLNCEPVNDNTVRFSVIDNGPGIPEDKQNELFKSFNRLGAETGSVEGTGIGLVIARNIIEHMSGTIGFESEVGKGSVFWFELPIAETTSKKVTDMLEDAEVSQELKETDGDFQRALYIEDNPASLKLVKQALEKRPNIQVLAAHEPVLGLDMAATHAPDVILLDINLPGMDGYEVLKRLRNREATRNTPVIAISANALPADLEKSRKAGFNDYITKPIDVPRFLDAIDAVLD